MQRGEHGTFDEQYRNVQSTMSQVADLIVAGRRLVITHGNGPQIGATVIRHDMSRRVVPPFPLHACGAETQGFLGYIMQQTLQSELGRRGDKRAVITVLTQVVVDPQDIAFRNPTKPIGPFYSEWQKEQLREERSDFVVVEDSGRGYRRVVASPDPMMVVETLAIKTLVESGATVIACGGGGIPVNKAGNTLSGVEAVVDKDLSAERLATSIGASQLAIMTDVDGVFLNYGRRDRRMLSKVRDEELRKYAEEGHFPPGSMGPKVKAVLRFLDNGGESAAVANLTKLRDAVEGNAGTQIIR